MIKLVSNILENNITGCTWLEKWGGLVQPVSKYDEVADVNGQKVSFEKVFPVNACMDASCFSKGKHNPLIPSSSVKSLAYLEQEGSLSLKLQSAKDNQKVWSGSIRLIVFLNYQKLGIETCDIDYLFVNEITDKIKKPINCKSQFLEENAAFLQVKNIKELPKNKSLFQQYSYSDEMTNLLLYPYSYFGLSINFELTINKKCFPAVSDIVPCEEIKCIKV